MVCLIRDKREKREEREERSEEREDRRRKEKPEWRLGFTCHMDVMSALNDHFNIV